MLFVFVAYFIQAHWCHIFIYIVLQVNMLQKCDIITAFGILSVDI